ncbi:MAG: hypothetical protein IIY21_26175 [Clostridiales bacterium]|nr:hypothetical protein [Clostridiales bacterium]MBQ1573096.1 hypothetical protein [Clostridiales bacterium]
MPKIEDYEAYKKFRDALLAISVSDNYEDACKEWEPIRSVSKETERGCCICGVLIVDHYYFRNTITGEIHTFGSVCVKNYSTDLSNALDRAIESEKLIVEAANTLKKLIKAMWWYGCAPVSAETLSWVGLRYSRIDDFQALYSYKDNYDGIPVNRMNEKYGHRYIEFVKTLCQKYRELESQIKFKTELKEWKPSEKRLKMIEENFNTQAKIHPWMIKTVQNTNGYIPNIPETDNITDKQDKDRPFLKELIHKCNDSNTGNN